MSVVKVLMLAVFGYAAGLLIDSRINRRRADESILAGIAGMLGASTPYVLLTSIWAEQWKAEHFGRKLGLLGLLTEHTILACFIICPLVVILVEMLRRPFHPAEQAARQQSADGSGAGFVGNSVKYSRQQAARWLWLASPGVVLTLWRHLIGPVSLGEWQTIAVGGLGFIGVVGCIVSTTLITLRVHK